MLIQAEVILSIKGWLIFDRNESFGKNCRGMAWSKVKIKSQIQLYRSKDGNFRPIIEERIPKTHKFFSK